MYDLKGFGKRIEELRKNKAMTQENLAEQLGVTGQAVSKWENGICYPDIELIPAICAIFEIELDDIFGRIKKDIKSIEFPKAYKGADFIFSFADVACYSDKEVEKAEGSSVTFTDGSSAELSSRRIVNKGSGKIFLKTSDEKFFTEDSRGFTKKPTETKLHNEYGKIKNLICVIPGGNCEILKTDGDKTEVYAEGYPEFIDLLEFEYNEEAQSLSIKYDRHKRDKINNEMNKWDNSKNIMKIKVAFDGEQLENLGLSIDGSGSIKAGVPSEKGEFTINGSGNIDSPVCFNNLRATINGSGNIAFIDADELQASINGSGDIDFKNTKNCGISINGSGDIKFDEAVNCAANINGSGDIGGKSAGILTAKINGSGDIKFHECGYINIEIHGSGDFDTDKITQSAKLSIRGSGDINLKSGEIEMLDVYLDNGKVNAKGVTTDKANIEIPNKGKIEIGRVKIESIEKCGDRAEVVIHKRG
jgi:transcriptional regulator with XRE-family HTH domain